MTPQLGSLALAGVGAATTGFGQYESGQEQRTAYDFNADAEAEALAQKRLAVTGRQASAYAASGVDIASGSPLMIMAATAARGAKEEQENTAILKYEGSMAAWSGTMSGIGSFLQGIGKAASAFQSSSGSSPTPGGGDLSELATAAAG